MRKILFPTDFSEVSQNAFVYALKLAAKMNAEIITLHTYELPVLDSEGFPSYVLDVYDAVEAGEFAHYQGQVPALRKIAEAHGLEQVPITHELAMGDLVESIRAVCKREDVSFVVMGTKGASGLKETFLGSTATQVISGIDPPVLAIPEQAEYHGIRRIGFTTRFRDKDRKALEKVLRVADAFQAEVHCLYIKTASSDVQEVTIKDWEFVYGEQVEFHIIGSDEVKDSILSFTETQQIEMLAMLHHKRGFFEDLFHHSLTKKIAHHITIPILALHDNA